MGTNTYSQIHIHIVFAVKGRKSLIKPDWEQELYKYITGIVQNKGQKMLAINGMPDHVHILIGMRPWCRLSDLVREIKKSSNVFIQEKGYVKFKFEWQQGYGAFSHSYSAVNNVIAYIQNQKEHHRNKTFRDEYMAFMKKFNVNFKEEYLFDWISEKEVKKCDPSGVERR